MNKPMNPPRATYRLQLNKTFTLADARALVPYLHGLGISHVYLSPVLKAQPGSTHGYDTVDHTRINPEIGSLEDFRALAAALRARDMGILLDFVPNHMGVGGASNELWLDVLRNGPQSRYAAWFDIDWNPPRSGMSEKLLVPFLGRSYAQTLADGDIDLRPDGQGFAVWAYGKEKLPIRPDDAADMLAEHGNAQAVVAAHAAPLALDRLIARQHWRLAHFATASDEINYRRFFINSELAGIRIDRPDVFEHAHRLIFALIAEGLVEGLRIDHIDGLLDPAGYLRTLRQSSPRPIYLAVEKILAPHEYLRQDWPIEGTTGYEVAADLTRLLTRSDGEARLTEIYESCVGPVPAPDEEAYRCKLRVMDNELSAELDSLARDTARLAWTSPQSADLTERALRRAWREIVAQLEVYRTYVDATGLSAPDRRELALALARARRRQPQVQPVVFDFIQSLLCGDLGEDYDGDRIAAIIGRFQQYSGPVMAKGLEDTALYRHNRLVSLNEVGAHPDRFSISIAAFHDGNRRRLAQHPHSLIGTSTHDTKRGEDIRMIIAAIADEPDLWGRAVEEWLTLLGPRSTAIHPNDLYLLFQLLIGGWPLTATSADFAYRLKGAMTKSLREARQRSDWAVNDISYEGEVDKLIDSLFANSAFLDRFAPVQANFAEIGRRKALIQTVLKFTIPGIPDIYRGAEDWEQSLVDPDNRRPLDFGTLQMRLSHPQKGRDDKLMLTQNLLCLRRDHHALFAKGSYEALDSGPQRLAFRRRHGETALTVVVDLSPGHSGAFAHDLDIGTIALGSRAGPFCIALSGAGLPARMR